MIKGLNFRQKILFSQIVLFIAFILCAFPFIGRTVTHIVFDTLRYNSCGLISVLEQSPSEEQMVHTLQNMDNSIFFGASLFDDTGRILYDSSLGSFTDEKYVPFYPSLHEEVLEALHKNVVYRVGSSNVTHVKLAYVIMAFEAHGHTYILRTSFSYAQVEAFAQEFKFWYLVFCFLAIVFFGALTWLVFHRINFPIQQIITAIKPYQMGKVDTVPAIHLSKTIDHEDDFYKLAQTLNSLSDRLRLQIQNITDERNEKEAILESLGEGVIAVDAEMTVRYINFVGSKMIGIPKRHVLTKPFPVIPDKPMTPLLERCQQILIACQEKQAILTDSITLGENKKIYLDLIAAPKSQRNGAILVLQDKSSHYRVLEMGKDFVANASHELRTPITIIKGFAETLQDMPELPREMMVDITEKIVRNCQRMDNLVKNLLTLADIENLPESRFQECDLGLLIENCRQVVLAVYETARIDIDKIKEPVAVFADPDILELAIINLLDNACKYSTPPAHITVKIDQAEEEVSVSISDRGIGIPEQDLERIFDRFYTVNKARSRRLGGAGLGLSIVKTIIEKHDGTISVSSELGVGTTFTIFLPANRSFS
ncbi:MAG: ATP-binding protein [Verrucomicrobia bacterium]|nr:ATP-binding protein [Verrucomicrobiota bacterium]